MSRGRFHNILAAREFPNETPARGGRARAGVPRAPKVRRPLSVAALWGRKWAGAGRGGKAHKQKRLARRLETHRRAVSQRTLQDVAEVLRARRARQSGGSVRKIGTNETHRAVRSVLLDQFPSEKTNDMSCSFCSGMFLPKNI